MNITQVDLAAAVGVHEMTIWRLEKNRHRPTLDLLVAIARALGSPIYQLWTVVDQ